MPNIFCTDPQPDPAAAHHDAEPAFGRAQSVPETVEARSEGVLGPPEDVQPSSIYKLYRGAPGEVNGEQVRIWAEFPSLQLCWATFDSPASPWDCLSLLDLVSCREEGSSNAPDGSPLRLEIYSTAEGGSSPSLRKEQEEALAQRDESVPALVVTALESNSTALQEFRQALSQLIESRDKEGRRGLEFIQKRLFQYLWRAGCMGCTEEQLFESQAVLAFNLDPRDGIAYLRSKLGKAGNMDCTEVGKWLAAMATERGVLDPTMLGAYFSRRDTLDVFKSFVRELDFSKSDVVAALRLLFDTFKPGGEGQVITRVLEMFAEAYFVQWEKNKDGIEPRACYAKSEEVEQVAVSLIMLNTGLHVAPKKNAGKRIVGAAMTVEEYIANTRRVVGPEEVPEAALRNWYDQVKDAEISVEPLPRASFSQLPVQPDIEGWLLLVLNSKVQKRYWAVLALQRLYLFSDQNEVEPAEAVNMRDARAVGVLTDPTVQERFSKDLHSSRSRCMCFAPRGRVALCDVEPRAFEVTHTNKPALLHMLAKPRTRLSFVAESPDLMGKWVSLISSGPY